MKEIPTVLNTPPARPNNISTRSPEKKMVYIHAAKPHIPSIIDTAMLIGSTPFSIMIIIIFGALELIRNEKITDGSKDAQRAQKSSASPLQSASERRLTAGIMLANTFITPGNSNKKYDELAKNNGSQSTMTVVLIEKTGIGTNSRPLLSSDIIGIIENLIAK